MNIIEDKIAELAKKGITVPAFSLGDQKYKEEVKRHNGNRDMIKAEFIPYGEKPSEIFLLIDISLEGRDWECWIFADTEAKRNTSAIQKIKDFSKDPHIVWKKVTFR